MLLILQYFNIEATIIVSMAYAIEFISDVKNCIADTFETLIFMILSEILILWNIFLDSFG